MAIGTTAAIGLGLAGLGSGLNAWMQNRGAQRQNAYGAEQQEWLRSLMGNGPSSAEQFGMNWLNSGQDGGMQSLRTDPTQKSVDTMEGIIENEGNPFDASEMFRALGVLDQRGLEEALATGRSAVPGLGQRFGSAQMRSDNDARVRAAEGASARNAGIQMQSFGDAQTRLMQAASGLGQIGAAENSQMAQILQAILGAEASRRGQGLGLAGLATQVGMPQQGPGYGNVLGGLGQLALLSSMGGGQEAAATPGYGGPWSMGGYQVPQYFPQMAPPPGATIPPNLGMI